MAVVFSRIAFVWKTAYYLHLVSDNKAFVVCIDACTYPNYYPVFLVCDILIQFCRSFHSVLQTADVTLLSVVGNLVIGAPAREILLVLVT